MKIVADENIARVNEYFDGPWQLLTMPGREINQSVVRDADILLVRSVTRVDADLLTDSRVKLVGSATSGVNHIDMSYLSDNGISVHHVAGSNAGSVVEYVFCALAELNSRRKMPWQQSTIGIVGAGHIGGRLARILSALDIEYVICDPYLSSDGEFSGRLRNLEEVLASDIVTIHVPLTTGGEHPTWHLLSRQYIDSLSPGTLLINSARGEVVDNGALYERLRIFNDLDVVLDTWEHEPRIAITLARNVSLGTAHIAGYSARGKIRGTAMLRQACNKLLGVSASETDDNLPVLILAEPTKTKTKNWDSDQFIDYFLQNAYAIKKDYQQLLTSLDKPDPAAEFDALRKNYRARAEFSQYRISGNGLSSDILNKLSALGFLSAGNIA